MFILFLLPLMTAIVLVHLLTDGPPYFAAARRPPALRMRPRDYAVVAVSGLGLVASIGLSVRLGAFPEIPRAWLVFLGILLVLFSAIAWSISRTIKG